MSLLHDPRFSSWARGHLLCRVDDVPNCYALTFDDGPTAAATPRVLERLASHGAKATFFLLAGNVRRLPGLVRRLVDEGHEAAVHGDRHWPVPLLPPALLERELRSGARAILEVAEVEPRHYRPPFGLMVPSQAARVRRLGYEPVLGDVYPEDPHRPGVGRIVRRVMAKLRAGSIVILHDGSPWGEADRDQTVEALEAILGGAADRGLRAVTVRELLGRSAALRDGLAASGAPRGA
jgi:peptidoglycan/xylan/chitin deacetylase (PgdA/CDA1 family)